MSQNPYAASTYGTPNGADFGPPPSTNPLLIPGITLIVISALGLMYAIFNLFITLHSGPPPVPANAPPGVEIGQNIGFYGAAISLPIFSVCCLFGAIAMVRRRGYAVAMTGAVMGLVPICGPCLIFAIPFSIWALVLLLKPNVKASFARD